MTRRRKYAKKRAFGNSDRNVPRSLVNAGLGFPTKMMAKLKYQETVVATTSGPLAHVQYILNGLFDPNFTGGGHQPLYFDQYMQLYNHYLVIGAKVMVRIIPYESNTVPIKITLWQNDDTTITPATYYAAAEQSKAKSKIIGSTGDQITTMDMGWSAKKTFGPPMANTLLRGNVSANPQEQSVAVFSLESVDGATTGSVALQIYIEYQTIFTELRDIGAS